MTERCLASGGDVGAGGVLPVSGISDAQAASTWMRTVPRLAESSRIHPGRVIVAIMMTVTSDGVTRGIRVTGTNLSRMMKTPLAA